MANYAFTRGKPLPTVENGHEFVMYNFAQASPHTPIFAGVTGLTFRDCNLTNCLLPADAVVIGSKYPTNVEFCGNLHPKWVDKGAIPACAENCTHVTGTDIIQVAGVTVATVYHYDDRVVN